MGQGTSEGTVPEENTPDTGRDEANDARTAGPDAPTPEEADTATRQNPVVPEGDDGAVSAEGEHAAELPEGDESATGAGDGPVGDDASAGDDTLAGDGAPADDAQAEDDAPGSAAADRVAADDAPAPDDGLAADGVTGTDDRAATGDATTTDVGPATGDVTVTDSGSATDGTPPAADGPAPDQASATDDARTGDEASDGDGRPSGDSAAADGVPRTRAGSVDPANDPRARAVATLTAAAAAAEAARAASEPAATAQGAAPVIGDATPETQLSTAPDGPSAERVPVAERTPLAAAAPSPADATAPTQRIASTDPAAQDSGPDPVAGRSDTTTVLPAVAGSTPTAAGTPGDGSPAVAVAGHPEEGSPLDVFESEPDRKRRWWRPVLIVAGVVVVLAGAYVGGAYALAERVPRGTTVAGIEVGGMSADDARAALTEGLAERSSQPITVTAREVSGTVDPAAAGLTFDVDATVDSLTGIDLSPQRMWRHLTGGTEEAPVTEVDETKLTAAVEDLSGALTLAPVDGSVVFVDGKPQGVAAVDGWSLDTEGAQDTLTDGWLTEALPIELPSDTVAPTITQDEVDRVVRDVASAVVSGPVTVTVADQSAELPVDVLTGAASFVPQGSELVLTMDGAALVDQVVERTSNLLTTAADATFQFADGAPTIVPGTPGTTLDPAALATAVATAAASTSERTAPVELVESDPAQSTEALQALGVTTAVSEFSTPLTSEPKRTQNITAGAAAINGTLIRPGETFSLTEALGPIDAAHGFVQAGAIVNGEHSDAWGGGLSQLSTTTFNAAFEAGMEDVEHQPHSEWFTRYPAGREATLYTGSIDMKWKNTTPYGVLVQAYVADGKTWVRLWSTPYYEVAISSGAKTNVVSPTTVYNTSPTCSASSAGNPGFSITVTRTVSLNGQVQDTDNLSWRYKPQNKVVCGPDPATAAPPAG